MDVSRRNFLKSTATSGLGALAPVSLGGTSKLLAASYNSNDDVLAAFRIFRHGLASGDPLPDAVILWTRITTSQPGEQTVRYQVADDPAFEHIILDDWTITNADRDYTVKVDVFLPESNQTYYYRFQHQGVWSMIGRTKTAPTNENQVRLAVVSCSSVWSGYMHAYERIAERNDLDLVIHCGDYIYDFADEDELVFPSRHQNEMQVPSNLTAIRQRYAYYRLDPFLRRAHQQHPFSIIWDNHDLGIRSQPADAMRAYHEWTPTRSPHPADQRYIYRHLPFGTLADIFLLDTRSIGRNTSIGNTQDASILGDEQFRWLCQQLKTSQANWKIIGNQVLMAPFQVFGRPLSKSLWDGYPEDRNRLLAFIKEEAIENVVVVSGDAHMSFAAELESDSDSVAVEFLPTSVSRGNIDEEIKGFFGKIAGSAAQKLLPALNPHIKYTENTENGYGIVDLNPGRARAEFWYTPILRRSSEQTLAKAMECPSGAAKWRSGQTSNASQGAQKLAAPEELSWFIKSQSYGGDKGMPFDDERDIAELASIQTLMLRSGARIDCLAFELNDGSRLEHGGRGGSESSLNLETDELIQSVEIYTQKKSGSARVFYLNFITNYGRSFEGGKPEGQYHRFDVPDGWQIVGFHGRSGKELDQVGFILRRRV